MLTNRISLRAAAAVGCATVVAGAAFGVSAFADSGASPEQAASAALPQDAPKAESQSEQEFFSDVEEVSDEQRASARQEAKERVEDANAAAGASGTAAPEKKEEEKEPDDGDDGGSAPPSGDPKGIAKAMLGDFGWSSDQFSGCLEPLWEKESNWNPSAQNPSSGAYGIPQALPGSKMATAGSDWQTNPATQIEWGLGYIQDRYGSPCEAWSHSQANGWY
ncbi:aggregation-promoting factor C-terminal-like domain-containing protein [Nocardiopsis chromatogenes]|uniref:aggregation-promoting factor C-terminal-like domain-containing protein n=1 Tax=Nocardiopsis chromatogenes TaxID=280239 RepID=UPI000347CAE1|nr:transglycosylase SLT domain-containing protein [Nocardiopsis chromatogenes]